MSRPASPDWRYRLLSMLLFLFWLLHACWHGLRYRQFNYIGQRLGISSRTRDPCIWIHASSVGEVELVRPLLEALSKHHAILLTSFTASGYQHARRIMPQQVEVQVLPVDFYPFSQLFAQRHNIKLALVAETELWPETLFHVSSRGTPLLQVNARLSAKSVQAPGWVRPILQQTLAYFDRHLTRTQQDVTQFESMGVDSNKIIVCGNLKYARSNEDTEYHDLIGTPYVLFASTHHPEEKLFAELLEAQPLNALTVIAPRHPQRAGEIIKCLQPFDFRLQQRSQKPALQDGTQVYLADTLGELKALMAHAKLVIMGGSFVDIGGHNVLEPARLGKAVITGPSDSNIRQDLDFLLQHQAILQVADIKQLAQHLVRLLNHPKAMQKLAANAQHCVASQQHVLQRYLQIINEYL